MSDQVVSNPAVRPEPRAGGSADVTDYSQQLNADRRWALSEGSRFFEGAGAVQDALRRLTARLEALHIPYAVVGGMALFHHGYRRFTEDIDLLVAPDDLAEIHRRLEGRGYLPLFEGSRNLRDTDTGVRIEFLTTGDYPGDGRPKPVAFPDPRAVSVERDGISYITLPALVELKLASGMSSLNRLRDLADVQELIKALQLPESFADQLDPYVAERFRELWRASQPPEQPSAPS